MVKEMRKIIADAEKHFLMLYVERDPDPQAETFLSDVLCFNAPRLQRSSMQKLFDGHHCKRVYRFQNVFPIDPTVRFHIFSNKIHMLSTHIGFGA